MTLQPGIMRAAKPKCRKLWGILSTTRLASGARAAFAKHRLADLLGPGVPGGLKRLRQQRVRERLPCPRVLRREDQPRPARGNLQGALLKAQRARRDHPRLLRAVLGERRCPSEGHDRLSPLAKGDQREANLTPSKCRGTISLLGSHHRLKARHPLPCGDQRRPPLHLGSRRALPSPRVKAAIASEKSPSAKERRPINHQ